MSSFTNLFQTITTFDCSLFLMFSSRHRSHLVFWFLLYYIRLLIGSIMLATFSTVDFKLLLISLSYILTFILLLINWWPRVFINSRNLDISLYMSWLQLYLISSKTNTSAIVSLLVHSYKYYKTDLINRQRL